MRHWRRRIPHDAVSGLPVCDWRRRCAGARGQHVVSTHIGVRVDEYVRRSRWRSGRRSAPRRETRMHKRADGDRTLPCPQNSAGECEATEGRKYGR